MIPSLALSVHRKSLERNQQQQNRGTETAGHEDHGAVGAAVVEPHVALHMDRVGRAVRPEADPRPHVHEQRDRHPTQHEDRARQDRRHRELRDPSGDQKGRGNQRHQSRRRGDGAGSPRPRLDQGAHHTPVVGRSGSARRRCRCTSGLPAPGTKEASQPFQVTISSADPALAPAGKRTRWDRLSPARSGLSGTSLSGAYSRPAASRSRKRSSRGNSGARTALLRNRTVTPSSGSALIPATETWRWQSSPQNSSSAGGARSAGRAIASPSPSSQKNPYTPAAMPPPRSAHERSTRFFRATPQSASSAISAIAAAVPKKRSIPRNSGSMKVVQVSG